MEVREELGLLHDLREGRDADRSLRLVLVLGHALHVLTGHRLVNHFHELLVSHVFTEFLGDPLNVRELDLSNSRVVENLEALEEFFLWVAILVQLFHEIKVLLESNELLVWLQVKFVDDFFAVCLAEVKANRLEGHLELLHLDDTLVLRVKELEALLDFVFLLLSEMVLMCVTNLLFKLSLRFFELKVKVG